MFKSAVGTFLHVEKFTGLHVQTLTLNGEVKSVQVHINEIITAALDNSEEIKI